MQKKKKKKTRRPVEEEKEVGWEGKREGRGKGRGEQEEVLREERKKKRKERNFNPAMSPTMTSNARLVEAAAMATLPGILLRAESLPHHPRRRLPHPVHTARPPDCPRQPHDGALIVLRRHQSQEWWESYLATFRFPSCFAQPGVSRW